MNDQQKERDFGAAGDRLCYTVPEAAVRLGVGQETVGQLARAGKIGSIKIGRRRLIPVKSLDAFLEANRTGGPWRAGGKWVA